MPGFKTTAWLPAGRPAAINLRVNAAGNYMGISGKNCWRLYITWEIKRGRNNKRTGTQLRCIYQHYIHSLRFKLHKVREYNLKLSHRRSLATEVQPAVPDGTPMSALLLLLLLLLLFAPHA